MVVQRLGNGEPVLDTEFDTIFPPWVRALSSVHWTPVSIAKIAARILVTKPRARVLDIGSGAGKFCIVGSVTTNGHFTGVEQRQHLTAVATELKNKYRLHNFQAITENIRAIDFSHYDNFYFFNPFAENRWHQLSMGDNQTLHSDLYQEYSLIVRNQLSAMKAGTRVVTYHSSDDEIPHSYRLVKSFRADTFKIWESMG